MRLEDRRFVSRVCVRHYLVVESTCSFADTHDENKFVWRTQTTHFRKLDTQIQVTCTRVREMIVVATEHGFRRVQLAECDDVPTVL